MLKSEFIIAFEGIDGSGKTTQCLMLKKYLTRKGIKARIIGRRFLLSTLLSFFISSDIIITDRYTHTIKIYLNLTSVSDPGKQPVNYVKNRLLSWFLVKLPKPKLLFFLDIDTNSALKRLKKRNRKPDKYETPEFLEIFAIGYRKEFLREQKNVHQLNAHHSIEQLHKKTVAILTSAISLGNGFGSTFLSQSALCPRKQSLYITSVHNKTQHRSRRTRNNYFR